LSASDASPIAYFAPEPDLAEYISSFYIARFDVEYFDELERADRPQLRLRLNSVAGAYHLPGGAVHHVGTATVIGPTSAPVRAVAHGPVFLAGMGFMPGGWATLMGPDAEHHTDQALDAHALWGDWVHDMAAHIAAAADDAARVALLHDVARTILGRGQPAPLWFTRVVDRWLMASLSPQVDALIAETGMSARSVERMTKRFYGLPPKTLARKYRALRAASALARGEQLDEALLGAAFYDQSHLIREVKQFVGTTPGKMTRPSAYTEATTKGRNQLKGRVSPLVTDT
jgi:AraC-like DNA-binding protein